MKLVKANQIVRSTLTPGFEGNEANETKSANLNKQQRFCIQE